MARLLAIVSLIASVSTAVGFEGDGVDEKALDRHGHYANADGLSVHSPARITWVADPGR